MTKQYKMRKGAMNLTSSEIVKLFAAIKMAYESFTVGETDENGVNMKVEMWAKALEDIDYKLAGKALQKHILISKYPPTIADIRENALTIIQGEQITGAEAWDIFTRYINLYSTAEDYQRLKNDYPDIYNLVKQLGSKELLIGNVSFIRPEFERMYAENREVLKTQAMLPESFKRDVQRLREGMYQQMLESGDEY